MIVLINSWYFDFKIMVAKRDPKWKHYDERGKNIQNFGIRDGKVFKKVWQGYKGYFEYEGFFDEPEDYHDKTIVDAYVSYLFEKEVLSVK